MPDFMNLLRVVLAAILAVSAPVVHTTKRQPTQVKPATQSVRTVPTPRGTHKMRVVWGDEFNGPAGSYPDAAKWQPRPTDQWQNSSELQNYTIDSRNASLDGIGNLVIRTFKEASGQKGYSSARLRGLEPFLYGLFEARIDMSQGAGIWPAWWMIGPDNPLGWPYCGELDIMEAPAISGQPSYVVHAGTHTPGASGADIKQGVPTRSVLPGFHTYAMDWQRDSVEWFVDGQTLGKVTRAQVEAAGGQWVFNSLAEVPVLNQAVGGWAGTPGAWDIQTMLVDYVRVWQ